MPSGVPSLPFPRFLAPPTSPPPSAVRRSSRWRYGPTRGPTPGRVPPTAASSHRPRPSLPPAALCTGAPTWLPPPGRGGRGRLPASAARFGLRPAGASRCLPAPASPAPQTQRRRAGGPRSRRWGAESGRAFPKPSPNWDLSSPHLEQFFESLPGRGWSQPDPTPLWAGSRP